jgi:phage baseplate assembly protein W
MAHAPTAVSNVLLMPVLGTGWQFPIAREGSSDDTTGRLAKLATASDEISVRQSIEIILSTGKGERVMRPDFGSNLNRLLFAPNNGATQALAMFEVDEALRMWEPRIDMLDVSVQTGGTNGEQLLINIHYRVRSTDNRFNLVYPFYLDRALT